MAQQDDEERRADELDRERLFRGSPGNNPPPPRPVPIKKNAVPARRLDFADVPDVPLEEMPSTARLAKSEHRPVAAQVARDAMERALTHRVPAMDASTALLMDHVQPMSITGLATRVPTGLDWNDPTQNTLPIVPGKKVFDYGTFIDKLRTYIETADKLTDAERHHDSLPFQEWKVDLVSLLGRAKSIGYNPPCNVNIRPFLDTYGGQKKGAAFERDITATLIELRALVKEFEEFGAPTKKQVAGTRLAVAEPEARIERVVEVQYKWPTKLTVHYLMHEVPPSAYVLLVTSFFAGLTAAKSDVISNILVAMLEHYSK
jgi:hypothetical protein